MGNEFFNILIESIPDLRIKKNIEKHPKVDFANFRVIGKFFNIVEEI